MLFTIKSNSIFLTPLLLYILWEQDLVSLIEFLSKSLRHKSINIQQSIQKDKYVNKDAFKTHFQLIQFVISIKITIT